MEGETLVNGTVGKKSGHAHTAWTTPVAERRRKPLVLYNSLTRKKEVFLPTNEHLVSWYACGPTVYDAAHMGHARCYVAQDTLVRLLKYAGYRMRTVMNVTDIDDKIILRARQAWLLKRFRERHPTRTPELLGLCEQAWREYAERTLRAVERGVRGTKMSLVDQPPLDPDDWSAFVQRTKSSEWLPSIAAESKFAMWMTALEPSREAILEAKQDGKPADGLLTACQDILAPWLDAREGSAVSDLSIFADVASHWEADFFRDMKALGVARPDLVTRVSDYVPEIVRYIETIIDRGFAYEVNGNVLFDIEAFDHAPVDKDSDLRHLYAKLEPSAKGNKALIEEGEGALSAQKSGKKNPSDFALWKASKPGEPKWPSPWGEGRPGWHIECTVMASETLGSSIDIHSGGIDLKFPHHDNELAQSEAYHGCFQWINYFVHVGHLHIDGLKMSKSLKNFITIKDALKKYSARQLRLAFLMTHWSATMNFDDKLMKHVYAAENEMNNFFLNIRARLAEGESVQGSAGHGYNTDERKLVKGLEEHQVAINNAIADSLDTVAIVRCLRDLITTTNIYLSKGREATHVPSLRLVALYVTEVIEALGLGERHAETVGWGTALSSGANGDVEAGGGSNEEDIRMPPLLAVSQFRDQVRQLAIGKADPVEFLKLADHFRDQTLVDLGVQLDDMPDGRAIIKYVGPSLRQAVDAKNAQAEAKAAAKAESQEKARLEREAKLRQGRESPSERFGWVLGSDGLPATDLQGRELVDDAGEPLTKSAKKKMKKSWDAQAKLHQTWLDAGRP